MAEPTTLARPYAKAAFDYAREANALAPWLERLDELAAVTQYPKVRALLDSPGISPAQKAESLGQLLGDNLPVGLDNLLVIMAENDRLELLPQVRELFAEFKAEQEKSIEVAVISAFPVSEEWQQTLTDTLNRKLNREILLTTEVDESLLGGAVIRAGDTVIDGSVKGRLARLAAALHA